VKQNTQRSWSAAFFNFREGYPGSTRSGRAKHHSPSGLQNGLKTA